MAHLEYLVGFGLAGDFGRFRAAAPLALRRGERVVIRGERGTEIGQVLRPAGERHARWMPNTGVGTLLRLCGERDEEDARRLAGRASELLQRGGELVEDLGLPVALLDAEVLLDGERAFVHLVRWAECDVRELVSTLSREFSLTIALADHGEPAAHEDDPGCGSCGSGGGCGDCGSGGGCGSCGSAKPEELQAHFAELRRQMERRVPLC